MGIICDMSVALKIRNAKLDFITNYCKEKGWNDQKITPAQQKEIRNLPEYRSIATKVKDDYGYQWNNRQVVTIREKIKSTRKERRKFFFKDREVRIVIVITVIIWTIIILWKT